MRKGFALPFVLMVGITILVGLIYYVNNKNQLSGQPPITLRESPGPYSGWKTYQNPTYRFSIRYPKEWFVGEYGDYAANFTLGNQQIQESSPAAIRVRFNKLSESIDLKTFEKIYKLVPQEFFFEPLDVRSKVIKIRNFDVEGARAVEYTVDRIFTALEGPKTEYSHIYEIEKEDVILKFTSSAITREEQLRGDGIFAQIIASIKF